MNMIRVGFYFAAAAVVVCGNDMMAGKGNYPSMYDLHTNGWKNVAQPVGKKAYDHKMALFAARTSDSLFDKGDNLKKAAYETLAHVGDVVVADKNGVVGALDSACAVDAALNLGVNYSFRVAGDKLHDRGWNTKYVKETLQFSDDTLYGLGYYLNAVVKPVVDAGVTELSRPQVLTHIALFAAATAARSGKSSVSTEIK